MFFAVFDNFLPDYCFHVFFVKIVGGPYASDLKRLSRHRAYVGFPGRNTFKLFYPCLSQCFYVFHITS